MTDTVFALATPPGRGAVAVIRLSGADCDRVLADLGTGCPPARKAVVRDLRHDGRKLDQALVLRFKAPNSYTGEDCVELHLHGGRAVVEGVSDALAALGIRPAEPGEFTRRAFENGKLDLTQAEAVADLIDAETSEQTAQALGQLGGALAEVYTGFRRDLLTALALVEAEIDFPDEDVPDALAQRAAPVLSVLEADLEVALADGQRGERIRDGYRIVLIGETNAGKSSLFNALVSREAAIVTPIAGTTRDVLDATLTLGGYAVTLSDTAGLRESDDPVEAEGVRRARARAQAADLRLWVVAPGDPVDGPALDLVQSGDLRVCAKADLGRTDWPEGGAEVHSLVVSPTDRTGMDQLDRWLAERLANDLSGGDFPALTRARHRRRLQDVLAAVQAAQGRLSSAPELAGEDLRRAADALARITGEIGVEDVLGEVFASFCIGK